MRGVDAVEQFSFFGRNQVRSAWAATFALAVLLIGSTMLMLLPPHLFVGAGLAVAVALILIVHPRAYLSLYLATGALNLAIFASQPRELFQSWGGMEPDGLRLLAFTAGGLLLMILRPRLFLMAARYRLCLTFLLVLGISVLYSPSTVEGVRLFLKICFPLLTYLFVIAEVRTEDHIRGLLRACVAGLGCAALVTAVRIASGDSLYIDDAGGIPRLQGPMGASSFSFYSTAVALLLYCYGTMRGKNRWIPIAGAAVMAGIVAATGTRVGVAGLLTGFVAVEFSRNRARRVYLISAVGLIAVGVLTPIFQRFAYSRDLHDLAGISLSGGFWGNLASFDTSGRDMLWRRVWEDLVMTSPLVGHGLGSANNYLTTLVGKLMVPHSELLRLLADTGLIGTILGVGLAVCIWRRLWTTRLAQSDPYEFLRPLAIGTFAAFLIFSLTDNILECYAGFNGYLAVFAGLQQVRVRQVAESLGRS